MIPKLLNRKSIFAALTAISLFISSSAAMTAQAADTAAVIEVDSIASLTSAISTANANPDAEYVINIKGDIAMAGALTISNTAGVTIKSDMNASGAPFTITKSSSGFHFIVNGSLSLEDIVLDGSWNGVSTSRYGGVDLYGVLYLNSGAVIENCSCGVMESSKGGGISGNAGSTTIVNGGIIRNNRKTGTNGGGGVYLSGANFTMTDGEISGNEASSYSTGNGGGISAVSYSSVIIEGGTISGNTAACNGGGVYSGNGVSFNMAGGTINGNNTLGQETSRGYGGGLCVSSSSAVTVNISGATIDGNTAYDSYYNSAFGGSSSGGGIYVSSAAGGGVVIINSIINANSADSGGGVYVNVPVSIIGSGIYGNVAVSGSSGNGGGVYGYTNSAVTVSGSIISGNKATVSGGGIYANSGVKTTTIDSQITSNEAGQYGGGIYGYSNSVTAVAGGTVGGNKAGSHGGGIYGYTNSTVTVEHGGGLSGNEAASHGGGIYSSGSAVTVNNASITKNTAASGHGGGIYGTTACYIKVNDCQITENNAPSGDGGGIYTADTKYAHLTSSDTAAYKGNYARAAYIFTGERYPDITSASVSIPGTYVLNNYDVNYAGSTLISFYTITYDANGGEGGYQDKIPPFALEYIVLSDGDTGISRLGYIFDGWNTASDGSGARYDPGNILMLTGDVIFYAQWLDEPAPPEETYTVTYDANGGGGGYRDEGLPLGLEYNVLSDSDTGVSYSGHSLNGWNTAPDGSGTDYPVGSMLTISGDITLYAKWVADITEPAPEPEPEPTPAPAPETNTKNVPEGTRHPYSYTTDLLVEIDENEVPLGNIETPEKNEIPLTGAVPYPVMAGLSCLFILGGAAFRYKGGRFKGK